MKVLAMPMITRSSPQVGLRAALEKLAAWPDKGPAVYKELNWMAVHPRDPRRGNQYAVAEYFTTASREFKPDLTFMQLQTAGVLTPGNLIHAGVTVLYNGDMRDNFPACHSELGRNVGLHLFANRRDVATARDMGMRAEYMPMGFSQTIFNPDGKPATSPPIVFMGANYISNGKYVFPRSEERFKMCEFLRKTYGNKFAVHGNGWPAEWKAVPLSEPEEASVYRGCKIAITHDHYRIPGFTSDRLFRAMACGPALIVNDFDGIDQLVPKTTLRWTTFDQLRFQIDLLLAHDQARQESAAASTAMAHREHTWDARMETLVLQLKESGLWQRLQKA